MEDIKLYTKEEVQSKINHYETVKEDLISVRIDINNNLKRDRYQIKKWRELDPSQYKIF